MGVADASFAQATGDEGEVRYLEVEQARTQMDSARRQLEEAARTITVQARVLPDSENRYATLTNFYGFGGQGRTGVSIVDADGGALVTALTPEGGAEEAGIRVGDVILSISGRTPNSPEHAIRILVSFEAGETIEFSIMRDGRRRSVEYALPELPGNRVPPVPVPD